MNNIKDLMNKYKKVEAKEVKTKDWQFEALEAIELLHAQYKKQCKCGKTHIVYTQKDNYPEYRTEIYIECRENGCKELVEFSLPAN